MHKIIKKHSGYSLNLESAQPFKLPDVQQVCCCLVVGVGVGEEKRAGPTCPPRSTQAQSCQGKKAARLSGLCTGFEPTPTNPEP